MKERLEHQKFEECKLELQDRHHSGNDKSVSAGMDKLCWKVQSVSYERYITMHRKETFTYGSVRSLRWDSSYLLD